MTSSSAAYSVYDAGLFHRTTHGYIKCWRGSSAQLEALYISDRVTRHPEQLCAQLSGKYGVTCQVGYPPYTQEDWDNRTRTELLKPRIDVTWADVGLYPPGKTAPRKFFPAVAPPRPERKLHTWIEQL